MGGGIGAYLIRDSAMQTYKLVDFLPELAVQLSADLRLAERPDLANEVPELLIVDRCRRCLPACSAFYCKPVSRSETSESLVLHHGAIVGVKSGRIVRIETLQPGVGEVLRNLFPPE